MRSSATTRSERSRVRSPPADAAVAAFALERPLQVHATRLERGHHAEEQPGADRHEQRDRQHAKVHRTRRRCVGCRRARGATSTLDAQARPAPRRRSPRPRRAGGLRPRTDASTATACRTKRGAQRHFAGRAVPRARSRLATFAHATSRTRPTASSRTSSAGRTGPKTTADSGSTKTPRARFSGYARSRSLEIAAISSCSAARDTSAASGPP